MKVTYIVGILQEIFFKFKIVICLSLMFSVLHYEMKSSSEVRESSQVVELCP